MSEQDEQDEQLFDIDWEYRAPESTIPDLGVRHGRP
jgi:hypothetical protein